MVDQETWLCECWRMVNGIGEQSGRRRSRTRIDGALGEGAGVDVYGSVRRREALGGYAGTLVSQAMQHAERRGTGPSAYER